MTGRTLAPTGLAARVRLAPRWLWVGLAVVWGVLLAIFHGSATLPLGAQSTTGLHEKLNSWSDSIGGARNSNPIFVYGINYIQIGMTDFVNFVQSLIAQAGFGRPAPAIGWFGVLALIAFVGWLTVGLRYAVLGVVGFAFIGMQGLWADGMNTLAFTLAAVLIAVIIGVPAGIWVGTHPTPRRIVLPILDLMQTMPTMIYLAPLTLLFLIGPASATVATLIFALPPVIRLTDHGIRAVPEATVEAADSLGATALQRQRHVLLPIARRTILLGINQTMMAALSMVTIAALISAPGLGQVVLTALQSLDVGTAFNSGLAIVVMAIVLDRITTAAGERVESTTPRPWRTQRGRIITAVAGVLTLVALWESYTYVWANTFPSSPNIGGTIISWSGNALTWVQNNLYGVTTAIRNGVTESFLNPMQYVLTESPVWLTIIALTAIAALLAGRWAALVTVVCLFGIVGLGVWQDAMTTLAMTLVATVLTMIIGIVVGVWMGRDQRVDRIVRPVLDALQVMPAFVYLVPFLALFGATRFTAIVAAMAFAVPVAVKVVADGIRGVPAHTVEAANSQGVTRWQMITQVQLPMAARSLTLATNQGLIYVLSMVVVGGMVGAGALGYDVYSGFVQDGLFGKGVAAGLAIVLLGVLLDRVSHGVTAGHEEQSA